MGVGNGSSNGTRSLDVQAFWLRPVVAQSGGVATLMLRLSAKERPGTRRAPVDVAIVLDRSGSMGGPKIDLAKQAIVEALSHLREEDRASVVVFDDNIDVVQALAGATPRVKTAIRLGLQGIDARGSTALCDGWLTGCEQLAEGKIDKLMAKLDGSGGRVRRTLLLTDGQANIGETRTEVLAHHAGELRQRGIGTTTLGLGLDFNEALLSAMAESGGGNFEFIEDEGQLRPFFEKELQELLTVQATGTTVAIDLCDGVEADLLNVLPNKRDGKRLEIVVGDVPAGAQIDLVLNLTHGATDLDTIHRLGVELAWTDPQADKAERVAFQTPAVVSVGDADVAKAQEDGVVAEQAAMLISARETREAVRLDREGRYAESRDRVRLAQQALYASPTPRTLGEADMIAQSMSGPLPYSEQLRKRTISQSNRRSKGRDENL